MPTGGAYEYDWASGRGPTGSGAITDNNGGGSIYRRVMTRRVYDHGGTGNTYTSKVTIDRALGSSLATVKTYDAQNVLLARTDHYYYGDPSYVPSSPTVYPGWGNNREYKTDYFATNGTTLLRSLSYTWQPRVTYSWTAADPRLVETVTTLTDTNQVSKQTFGYDDTVPYNNQNNVKEYDFGSGTPGPLLRETRTTYVTAANYTGTSVHLRSLPTQVSIYNALNTLVAQTVLEYDNYGTADAFHAVIVTYPRPGLSELPISGLDAAFNSTTNNLVRGNVTKTTHNLLNTSGTVTGSISSYAQYDVAGNVVKAIDPRSTPTNIIATSIDYRDCFGGPDGNAHLNSQPLELSSVGQASYAFATSATNSLSHTTYSQFDYYSGQPVDVEDANGTVASGYYNDALDRPTQVSRAVGTSLESQTTYTYDDVNRIVTTTSDQATFNDNVLKSQIVYDGLGRATEARQYENSTQYIATQKVPFIVLQDPDTGELVSAVQSSNPFRPYLGEQPVWTTAFADALGRTTKVRTPDNAIVRTTYSGSSVTVSDQTGRQRKSVSDALGRLKEVYEAPNDAVNYNYLTSYDYDVLGNLLHVYQGSQTRTFTYDSLSRLATAMNPESGTINYQYDNSGNLTQKTDARGVISTYAYDNLNRIISVVYTNDPTGTPAAYRYYDGFKNGVDNNIPYSKGRLWQSETGGATASRTTINSFDALGRPLSESQQFYAGTAWSQPFTVQRNPYNLAGGVTLQTYPSGHLVTYNYDSAGRLGDKDSQNLAFTGNLGDGLARTYSRAITYSPFGSMVQEQFGTDAAVYNKLAYNSRGQLAEIKESTMANDSSWNRGKFINWYSLQCGGAACNNSDNNGNLRKQETFVPNSDGSSTSWYQQYEYDSLNRLTEVHEHASNNSLLWHQSFTYDRFGNRTINANGTSGGVNNQSFEIETASNRLLAPGDSILIGSNLPQRKMRYDAAGNLTNDNWSSYGSSTAGAITRTYDAENRMTSAWDSSGGISYYTYNADGQRVRRKNGGVETWQVYGMDGELLAEYAANTSYSSPQKEYGYRNGQLLIMADTGATNAPVPSSLVATPPTNGAGITLSWTAASGATNYRVDQKAAGGSYHLAGTTVSTSLADNTAASGNAYLYRVCAANAQGNCTSNYSNIALGAAVTFPTDATIKTFSEDPLNATSVKAAHLTELRSAVNAVRTLAGLSAATWTYPNVVTGNTIHVEDVRELRTKLGEALTALGIQAPTYTDATLKGFIEDPLNASTIKAAHIRELRLSSTSGIGGSGGGGAALQLHWLVSDQLGTPRIVIDQSGSLANASRHDYLPFGEELTTNHGLRTSALGYSSPDGVRQKFTSYERDNETELDFAQARYYSSRQGRFTSVDPLMESARLRNPQTWNRYTYVKNRPLSLIDPTGMGDCTPQTPCYQMTQAEADRSSKGLIEATVDVNISDHSLLEKPTVVLGTTIEMGSIEPAAASAPKDWDPTCAACDAFIPATANAVAPIPRAVAAFAGASVVGGVALGAAPALAEAAFATGEGQAVFWSGYPEAQAAAMEFAETTGGSTIESTFGGRILNATTPAIRSVSPQLTRFLWNGASRIYAAGATGTVNVFLNQTLRNGNAWENIERPILEQWGVQIIIH